MKNLRKIFSTETKTLQDERALLVTISTPTPDRVGDVVVPQGAKLDNYQKNPVVLLFHDYQQLPIGKATDLQVSEAAITAKVQFPAEGTSPKADEVYALYQQGIMNAWSIGFKPNYEKATSIQDGGWKFNEWELLEFSAVPVPANPDALTMMRSKGLKAVDTIDEVQLEDDDFSETLEAPEVSAEVAEVEAEEVAPEPEAADEIVVDEQEKTLTITTAKGVSIYALQEAQVEAFRLKTTPVDDPQPENVIELTVESLKLADQAIGRALRDLKLRNTSKQSSPTT